MRTREDVLEDELELLEDTSEDKDELSELELGAEENIRTNDDVLEEVLEELDELELG